MCADKADSINSSFRGPLLGCELGFSLNTPIQCFILFLSAYNKNGFCYKVNFFNLSLWGLFILNRLLSTQSPALMPFHQGAFITYAECITCAEKINFYLIVIPTFRNYYGFLNPFCSLRTLETLFSAPKYLHIYVTQETSEPSLSWAAEPVIGLSWHIDVPQLKTMSFLLLVNEFGWSSSLSID